MKVSCNTIIAVLSLALLLEDALGQMTKKPKSPKNMSKIPKSNSASGKKSTIISMSMSMTGKKGKSVELSGKKGKSVELSMSLSMSGKKGKSIAASGKKGASVEPSTSAGKKGSTAGKKGGPVSLSGQQPECWLNQNENTTLSTVRDLRSLQSHPGKDPEDFSSCKSYQLASPGLLVDCIGSLNTGSAIIFDQGTAGADPFYCCPNDCQEVAHCGEPVVEEGPCSLSSNRRTSAVRKMQDSSCNPEENYVVATSFDNFGENFNCRLKLYCCPRKTPIDIPLFP